METTKIILHIELVAVNCPTSKGNVGDILKSLVQKQKRINLSARTSEGKCLIAEDANDLESVVAYLNRFQLTNS